MKPSIISLKGIVPNRIPIPDTPTRPSLNNIPRVQTRAVGPDGQMHVYRTYADGRKTDTISYQK